MQASVSKTSKNVHQDVLREIERIKSTQNPPVQDTLTHVVVLSGRNSYLKRQYDPNNVLDLSDDHNRMNLGVHVCREVAALRSGKSQEDLTNQELQKYGPPLIYNGRPEHNQDLRQALASNLIPYPPEHFRILELPENFLNTKGQMISLMNDLPITVGHVALVTHAYHFPRVLRLVGKGAPLRPFGPDVKITGYLVDRLFLAPGAEKDVLQDLGFLDRYLASGDLQSEADGTIEF